MTADYIAWAQLWCPEKVTPERGSLGEARMVYDLVDERLGDDAENDEFLTRVFWLEMAIRLARLGWTIEGLENARWPASRTACVFELIEEKV